MTLDAINQFDLIVLGVLSLSAILSFFRGFVREVLSLGTWAGASIVTLYMFPHVALLLKPHIKNTMVASSFATLFSFMASLILLSLITGVFMRFVKKGADIGLLDHGMGLLFGLLRGALLVSIGYFIFSLAVTEKHHPKWMKGAITQPYAKSGAELVAKIAPSYLEEILPEEKKPKKDKKQELLEEDDSLPNVKEEGGAEKENAKPSTHWPTMDDLKETIGAGKDGDQAEDAEE